MNVVYTNMSSTCSRNTFRGIIFACGTLRKPVLAPDTPSRFAFRGIESYGIAVDIHPVGVSG